MGYEYYGIMSIMGLWVLWDYEYYEIMSIMELW